MGPLIPRTLLPSAARTAAQVNSDWFFNPGLYRGGHIILRCSAFTAGTYTAKIQGFDPASEQPYDILVASGANVISGTGVIVLKVGPGMGVVAGGAAADFLPEQWRVQLNGAGGQSMTFSVGFNPLREVSP